MMRFDRQKATTLLARLRSVESCTSSPMINSHFRDGNGYFPMPSLSQGMHQGSQDREGCTSTADAPFPARVSRRGCPSGGQSHNSDTQRRCQSTSSVANTNIFTYHGPLSQTLKNLKRLSISGAAVSVFGSPILVMNTAETMPFAAQASICFTIASFGIFTTSLLHWFTSPYVHQLDFNRELREGEAKTLSIFAQPQIQRFNESEIKFSDTMRPQVTFEVRGKPFYLDPNAFEDKELLQLLSPPDPAMENVSMPDANSSKQS